MSNAPDEVDRHKAGTLPTDPKADTKPVAMRVPAVRTMREILTASRKRAFSRDPIEFLTTSHFKLDDITGGIRAPDSWVIAGDTSFGKTSLLIAIADENIRRRKKRVLVVSTEDNDIRFGDRFMVRRSGVSARRYRGQRLTPEEMRKVTDVENAGEPIPVYVDARDWDVETLVPHLIKIIDGEGIDLVAFDYLQEFRSKARHQDERVKFKEIAARLRGVGKSTKRPIPSIILSQLTLTEKTGVPTRANIRECRDVANAADVILIGFEPDNDIRKPSPDNGRTPGEVLIAAGTKCIYVDKNKDGPRKAKVPMTWSDECACFDLVKDPEQEAIDRMAAEFEDFADVERRYP